ncbi:hypothetical protein, partial [Allorhizobium ampelinum]|uniref:hypothetical protein n=1 Tax=Allorhizobium ampelinum TaxID=3025782 RepID=UPI001F3A2D93
MRSDQVGIDAIAHDILENSILLARSEAIEASSVEIRNARRVVTLTGPLLPTFRVGRRFRRCKHPLSVLNVNVFRHKSLLTQ